MILNNRKNTEYIENETAFNSPKELMEEKREPIDFAKLRVGSKLVEDAILTDVNKYSKINRRLGDKDFIIKAIESNNLDAMIEISNFFYKTSGIYSRLCRYMAYLYRYDWMVTPYVNDKKISQEKVIEGFYKAITYLDNFEAKKFFGEVALKVIRYGSYYGYKIPGKDKMIIQELPSNYCRSRISINNRPAVEFNMSFFDKMYRNTEQKMRVLDSFPNEFKKGYILYKKGKLPPAFPGDADGWYLLDPNSAFKFNINGEDFPAFISVIPAIVDLAEAQDLDRQKMAQRLLKIIIQKMPIDKNGDLVFDVDEAQQLHNNAVQMLGKAIGIDVLTTFADVDVADMADRNTTTTVDDLSKVERTVYNEAGVSQMQFNTSGNLALEKSILNDEAAMYNLLVQFEGFLNDLLSIYNKSKRLVFKAQILTTTIYNYKDLAKLYKEQTQLGYSKMLPQIALGQSQSSVLANAYFENDVLQLYNVFIPPLMSSTMNGETLQNLESGNKEKKSDTGGRPEKENDEKSEKTIQNLESQN